MKKLNTKQLYSLIENKVREALLNESMYDDYEYFDEDGKGGYDANPYPYGTEMGDADDWQEKERKAQIDSDFDELEKLNRKHSYVKKYPRLSGDFNLNVDDGRENAEAYADGLMDESKLTKAIMKKINERLLRIANN